MRTKTLALCLAVVGLGSVAVSEAGAREIAPAVAAPAIVRVNAIEVSIGGRRHYRHRHYARHSRLVRHVYYRHGRRHVSYDRVYY